MRAFFFQLATIGIVTAGIGAGSASARADIFVLANEGQISGELVNRDEKPRQTYVIKTAEGATITLDKAQVKQVVPQSVAEIEYEKIRPTFADTAEDQWRLAEWCKEKSLTKARNAALERVIELNPDHKQARSLLGYSQVDGKWQQRDDAMRQKGYVLYDGRWMLPQEVALFENRQNFDKAEKQWFVTLKRLRGALDDPAKAELARDEINKIKDPLAARALVQALNAEKSRDVCVLYIHALGRLGPGGERALVEHALDDADEEIRLSCLDELIGKATHSAVALFVDALRSKDNARVNRAGLALGKLGDASAVSPLIDALATTHKFTVVEGTGNPNSMSTGFSKTGGGGMTVGGGTKQVSKTMNNQQVLDALVALAGGANFGFDSGAWKNWYASRQKPGVIDTRRD